MKRILPHSLLFLSLVGLGACASLKDSSEEATMVEKPISAVDTLQFDFNRPLPDVTYRIFRASKSGLSGWMNIDGDWIIPPVYDTDFEREWSEGILVAKKNGRYGAINYKNEIVIPFEYTSPPTDCSNGLILVTNTKGTVAYFSVQGERLTGFADRQPAFHHGLAIVRGEHNPVGSYPRITENNANLSTQIYTGDFAVVNTQMDTILNFKNVPFLLEFGTLSHNRRTFFIHPHLARHADLGLSHGQHGYLNGNGQIVVPPQFRSYDVFTRILGGIVPDADCPFYSNRAMLREGNDYAFIDTSGKQVFRLSTAGGENYDVSHFNDYGVAGYRRLGRTPFTGRIFLINTDGTILHNSLESEEPMTIYPGNITHQPQNNFIPIYNKNLDQLEIHQPDFTLYTTLPLRNTDGTTEYEYGVPAHFQWDETLHYIQGRRSPSEETSRLLGHQGAPLSSWFPQASLISLHFGNFTWVTEAPTHAALYDAQKSLLYECDSCYIRKDIQIGDNGLYKVFTSDGVWIYVNYRGQILSDSFDEMKEHIIDLTDQIESFNTTIPIQITATEEEFIQLFRTSEMNQRIAH